MELRPLITVIDSFIIENRGLIVLPDFSIPADGWKDTDEEVAIQKPDGKEIKTKGKFTATHFSIADPNASIDRRWRVTLLLRNCTKDDSPLGSKIYVSSKLWQLLCGKNKPNKAEEHDTTR